MSSIRSTLLHSVARAIHRVAPSAPGLSSTLLLRRIAAKLVRYAYARGALVTVATRHGFSITVDPHTRGGSWILLDREYEGPTTSLLLRLLEPGNCFLDVGANLGYYTLLASQRVGQSGRVFAVEPLPYVRSWLENNVAQFSQRNVTILPFAAWDSVASLKITCPLEHHGMAYCSLNDTPQTRTEVVYDVEARPLDGLLKGASVNVAKIDIEGAELRALKGLKNTLECCRPHLVIEVTPRFLVRFGDRTEDVWDYLYGFGYTAYRFESDDRREILPRDIRPDEQLNVWFRPAKGAGNV